MSAFVRPKEFVYLFILISFLTFFYFVFNSFYVFLVFVSYVAICMGIIHLLSYFTKSIWYKKKILNKFKDKEVFIKFSVFDTDLKRHKIKFKTFLTNYKFTEAKELIFKVDVTDNASLYFRCGLFCPRACLADRFGNCFNFYNLQLSSEVTKVKSVKYLVEDINRVQDELASKFKLPADKSYMLDVSSIRIRLA